MTQEVLEQGKLARGQRDHAAVGGHVSGHGIEIHRAHAQLLGTSPFLATKERVQPRHEDRSLERFAEKVVRAHVKALDLIPLALFRGEQSTASLHPRRTQVLTDPKPAALGQHDVKNDDVVSSMQRRLESGVPVVELVDHVSFIDQETGHRAREVVIVLDEEHLARFITHCR